MATLSIDDLIRNQNPFAGHTVVRPSQIWGKSFPDAPSINSHASDAVLQAVNQVHQGLRQAAGITILGEKGLGKTQTISRIRHTLQKQENALFVYMGKYDNLNQINNQFLQNVSWSLRSDGNSPGIKQWQELAACLINEAKGVTYPPQYYVKKITDLLSRSRFSGKNLDPLTDQILAVKSDIENPYLVKAVLWTLSPAHISYASYWLSGAELTPTKAQELGLPNPKGEDREAESLTLARQILDLTSDYRVPVICFDELDDLNVNDSGWTAAHLTANLGKNLSNSLKRSVLLLAMYAQTWNSQIKGLPQAEAVIDRIANYPREKEPISLKYLDADDVVVLVSSWLRDFYNQNQQNPPSLVYPFNENNLRQFGKQKASVRDVIRWCAENFSVSESANPSSEVVSQPFQLKPNSVEAAYQNELAGVEEAMDNYLEENTTIANALWLGFRSLIGHEIEQVMIEDITKFTQKFCSLDFKIIGKIQGETVKIGVVVLQDSAGKGVQATLKQLIDYKKYDLTRGCLVRSKKISSTAALAQKYARTLLYEQKGEWVMLQAQDIKPLIVLDLIYQNRESYELSEEQIMDFIAQKQLAINNPLLGEILSAPSGQEPDHLINEDLPISIPQSLIDSGDEPELSI